MTDWATAAAATFAGIGLLFAGEQVRQARKQDAFERNVALNGVVVTWQAIEAPDHPDVDGSAEWLYRVLAHNPARLPIDNIEIKWHFPCAVQRVRYSGRLGDATQTLTLRQPVLAGQGERMWNRRLKMDFAAASDLRDVHAEITFRDIQSRHHTNRWPREI